MSNQADIRDIQILGDLKAAFGRFGEDVSQILPSLQKQFEEIQEQWEERQDHWRRQVETAQEEVYEARRSLNECQSQPADEEGDSADCSSEEDQVADAEKLLAEYEENLETVKQWRHRVEALIADFQNDIHRLSNLASARTSSAQGVLANKLEILNRYVGGDSGAATGLHGSGGRDRINTDTSVAAATAKMRDIIRNAQYNSFELLKGGINQTVILKNGVKVVFKPAEGEHPIAIELRPGILPRTQYRREKAASMVDELLGLGLVPPTEIITYEGLLGSAQIFKENFKTADELETAGDITLPCFERLTERQRQDWQLLDELSGNMDRHNGNWMLHKRSDSGFDLALIDNGLCFSEVGETWLLSKPASQQKLDSVSRSRIERLLATETEWRSKLSDLVGIAAVEHMIKRAQRLLTRNYYE